MEYVKAFEEIEKHIVTCTLCAYKYNQTTRLPKLLTACTHTFCLTCIKRWVGKRRDGTKGITCPDCQSETTITDADQLHTNLTIRRLQDILEKQQVKKTGTLGNPKPRKRARTTSQILSVGGILKGDGRNEDKLINQKPKIHINIKGLISRFNENRLQTAGQEENGMLPSTKDNKSSPPKKPPRAPHIHNIELNRVQQSFVSAGELSDSDTANLSCEPITKPSPAPRKKTKSNKLDLYSWYHGQINRKQDTDSLRSVATDGCFLVRRSTKGDEKYPYTLAIFCQDINNVCHLRIQQKPGNMYALEGKEQSKTFKDVPTLIEYYMKEGTTIIGRPVILRSSPQKL